MFNETVHSGYTDPTQATARLVIVLVSRIQKSGTRDNNFVNGKGHFCSSDRNDQTGQRGPPSKLVPNMPVGPNRNGPFHLICQPKFLEFWVEWKAPYTNGLDDVWAGCNADFLLHGDTTFRFNCNCFW